MRHLVVGITQCKLLRVKTILGTSRSRMQQPIAVCTRAQSLTRPCPCAIMYVKWFWVTCSSRMDASHVCTLDNALVSTRKTPQAQVAEGQDHLGH